MFTTIPLRLDPHARQGQSPRLDKRFELGERVATGGMGQLFRGFDHERQTTVAIKMTLNHSGSRANDALELESEILAQLQHPGIVSHIAHGRTGDGRTYLVMEWLEGSELRMRLGEGTLSENETIELAIQLCQALDATHQQGITHRDITPSNILLVSGEIDVAKLIDFGLAVHAQSGSSGDSNTLVGTPGFMSPEQARGATDYDLRTDIFALGAVCFACLTRTAPFTGKHAVAVLAKTVFEAAPEVIAQRPDISPGLNALIAKMLSTNREERPHSAAEVADELHRLQRPIDSVASVRYSAVSLAEQRLFTVLLIDEPQCRRKPESRDRVCKWAEKLGAVIQPLVGGTLLAVFSADGDPAGMARVAAGLALRIAAEFPNAAMSVATGRGQLAQSVPIGRVIDRAVAMLFGETETLEVDLQNTDVRANIAIDDVTAQLVQGHFRTTPVCGEQFALEPRMSSQHRAVHATTELLGRTQELATLHAHYRACTAAPQASITALTGAPGIGKSALAMTHLDRVGSDKNQPTKWFAFADAVHAQTPFGIVRQLFRSAIGGSRSEAPADVRDRLVDYMLQLLPNDQLDRCVPFLGELLGAPFDDQNRILLREARRDRQLMYEQMYQAWRDWLDAESRKRPLILFVDDVHHCDSPSMEFLRRAMDNLEHRPIWLFLLAQPSMADKCPALWLHPAISTLALQPLSHDTCIEIARRQLPAQHSAEVVTDAVKRCAGNPLFLQLVLRALERGRDDQMSATVLAVVGSQISGLDEVHRQTLRAASVFGRNFSRLGVKQLLCCTDEIINEALAVLVREQLIAPLGSGPIADSHDYRFNNEQIHGAAYATLVADDRARAHERAADWCERQPATEPAVIAHHLMSAGQPRRAQPWLVRAAQQALDANNPSMAGKYAKQVIDRGGDGQQVGQARQLYAESLNWCSEHFAALRNGRCAMTLLPKDTDDWANSAQQVIWAAGELALFDEVLATADKLMRYLIKHDGIEHAITLAWCASHLTNAGHANKSEQIVRFLRSRRGALGASPSLDAVLAHASATLALTAGLNDRSAVEFNEASMHWECVGNQTNTCMDACNAAESLTLLGQYEVAEQTLRHYLGIARELQIDFLVTGASLFLANTLIRTGAIADAQAIVANLLANKDRDAQLPLVLLARARIALTRGNLQSSLSDCQRAIVALDGFPHSQAMAHGLQAQALMASAQPQQALRAALQGMRLLYGLRFIQDGDALLHLMYAKSLAAVGRVTDAKLAFANARARLLNRADMMHNRDWRWSFLTRVGENHQTILLAEEYLASTRSSDAKPMDQLAPVA